MKPYLDLMRDVLENGTLRPNRTGINSITMPGAMVKYDLAKGFPATTTKKLAFKSVVGELCAFLRASQSAADFRALGCNVWDENANKEKNWLANPYRADTVDALGPVYGAMWRKWPGFKRFDPSAPNVKAQMADAESKGWDCLGVAGGESIYTKEIDQLRQCLDTIVNNPYDRRILFHAWNPSVLDEVALPACHLLYQMFPNPATREISMTLYIRSNDLFLGHAFNCAEAAVLLHLIGRLTGYTPKTLTIFIGDAHLYENCIEETKLQLSREPFAPPKLVINDRVPEFHRDGYHPEWLDLIEPSDFALEGYQHHEAIKAKMAV